MRSQKPRTPLARVDGGGDVAAALLEPASRGSASLDTTAEDRAEGLSGRDVAEDDEVQSLVEISRFALDQDEEEEEPSSFLSSAALPVDSMMEDSGAGPDGVGAAGLDGQGDSYSMVMEADDDDLADDGGDSLLSALDGEEQLAMASMRRVEERLDALEAEAEYKARAADGLRQQLRQSMTATKLLYQQQEKLLRQRKVEDSLSPRSQQQQLQHGKEGGGGDAVPSAADLRSVFDHLGHLSADEARSLLKRCCIRVAEMKEQEGRRAAEAALQEDVIAECRQELVKAKQRLDVATR